MPQPIAYNSGNPISGSIEKSTLSFTVEGAGSDIRDYDGSYAGVNWYSTIPPQDGKYVIISASNPPMIWVTADETDAELLTTINGLPDRYNQTLFTDTGSALSWLGSNAYFVSRETPDQINADGIRVLFDAKNLSSYPRTGTTWYDLSGNDDYSILYNGATFWEGGAIEFDGVDDYAQTVAVANGTNSVSVEVLVNTDSLIAQQSIIFNANGQGLYPRIGIYTDGRIYAQYRPVGNTTTIQSIASLGTNKWNHILFSYDNALGGFLYINGNLDNSNTSTLGNHEKGTNYNIKLGYDSNLNQRLNGKLAKAKVYNQALSASDALQNYYGGPIVTDGLVLAVDAGNLVSYESGSTTTYSLTGSLSGSLTNGVGYNSQNGGTWVFDGIDDYITFGNNTATNFYHTDAFSLEAWIKPSAFAGFDTIIGGGYGNYRLAQNSNTLTFRLDSNNLIVEQASLLQLNEWQHVAATYDPNTFTAAIYYNGRFIKQGTDATLNWSSTNNFGIGMSVGEGNPYYFPGNIAVGRVYNKTLTAAEVAQNYSATKQKYLF